MAIVGIIFLGIFAFVFLGLMGWVLKAFGFVFDFLWEGCSTSLGCLFWAFIIIILLMAMI